MASFSGRVCDLGGNLQTGSLYQRSTVVLPKRHGVMRVVYKSRDLQCNAIALKRMSDVPWVRTMLKALHIYQEEPAHFSAQEADSASSSHKWTVVGKFKDATLTAVHMGLSLTGAALHLASRVVAEWQAKAREMQRRKQAEKQKVADQQMVMGVQTQLQYEIQRQRLEKQGQDKAFVSMLHVLDRCHLDHDVKWALVQKHTADKAEFSERLQQLYNLAEASKDAVDTLLRPDASRQEINTFWRSPETVAIIAEEDKLKSLVFAQMLQAGVQ